MTKTVYLIVEPIEIIASDLALCVQDYDPAAKVFVAERPEGSFAALEDGEAAVRVAFIHADPTGFHATDLGRALAGRGAYCVFMGDRAEREGKGIAVLQRPFSFQTIAALLDQLIGAAAAQSQSGAGGGNRSNA